MTDLQALLERMRKLEAEASEEPWLVQPTATLTKVYSQGLPQEIYAAKTNRAADADFIAVSRNLLGPLLDVVEAAAGLELTPTGPGPDADLFNALARLAAKGVT